MTGVLRPIAFFVSAFSVSLICSQPAQAGEQIEKNARAEAALAGSAPTAGRMKPTATVLLGSPELTSGISGNGPLTVAEIKAWLALPSVHEVLKVELPLGLSAGHPKGLEANPLTRGKIELGRQLYFDARLSSDGTVSCASCHAPEEAWVKHSQFGIGIRGQVGGRNSPPSFNRILSDAQFWDGRADSLEAQAKGPIANPIEMGNTHAQAVAKIAAIEGYRLEFAAIFGNSGVTIDNIAKAIASFERSVVTGSSPFDYYEATAPVRQNVNGGLGRNEAGRQADLRQVCKAYGTRQGTPDVCQCHPRTRSLLQ